MLKAKGTNKRKKKRHEENKTNNGEVGREEHFSSLYAC
jgi:hypothetical protein